MQLLTNKVDKDGTKVLSEINFSQSDKTKIDNLPTSFAPTNATINSTDSDLLNRQNHTGTQPISSITDLETILNKVAFLAEFLSLGLGTNSIFVSNILATGTQTQNIANNRQGVVRIASSATVNSGVRISNDLASIILQGNEYFECGILPLNIPNARVRGGFLDTTNHLDPVDGAYFEYSANGQLFLKTSNNSVRSTSTLIATLFINTWYKISIKLNDDATLVTLKLYNAFGIELATQSLSKNIPKTLGREVGCGIVATNITASVTPLVDLDFLKLELLLIR